MGCLLAKLLPAHERIQEEEEEQPRQYSWDKRSTIDKSNFIAENLSNQVVERLPGSINGQQFIIQNCKDCDIYVFDCSGTVSIDECTNCRIILGPVKTSIFVRDCTDCQVSVACQQFRTRDCKRVDVWLHCITQPIIEATTGIRFGCLQMYYNGIEDQFRMADINVFSNNWSAVHDFTPVMDEINFSFVHKNATIEEKLSQRPPSERTLALSLGQTAMSAVPLSLGKRRRDPNESCLVAYFTDSRLASQPMKCISKMLERSCELVHSNHAALDPDRYQVFQSETLAHMARAGPIITLEFCGPDCIQTCQSAVREVASELGETSVFVTLDAEEARKSIDELSAVGDMQMAV